MIKRLIYFFAVLSAIAGSAHAARPIPADLECHIKNQYSLEDDGALKKASLIKNGIFIVNRFSGAMMGKSISNTGERIMVIDQGSDQQAFKALSVNTNGYTQPTYIEISVFSESTEKPFKMIYFGSVFSGTCQ